MQLATYDPRDRVAVALDLVDSCGSPAMSTPDLDAELAAAVASARACAAAVPTRPDARAVDDSGSWSVRDGDAVLAEHLTAAQAQAVVDLLGPARELARTVDLEPWDGTVSASACGRVILVDGAEAAFMTSAEEAAAWLVSPASERSVRVARMLSSTVVVELVRSGAVVGVATAGDAGRKVLVAR